MMTGFAISADEKRSAMQSIVANANFDASYVAINAIATIIACAGLLANSTAVVIGSMLIAALLPPISGIALALVNADTPTAWDSVKTLVLGVVLIFAIAFLFGLMFPHIEATDRMLARTAPGIFDFIIAFFGGIAGAIAILWKRYEGVMVGVGIATALVPPLSTAGIFFSKGVFDLGSKALELALINIIFILIANVCIFAYFGLRYDTV